MNTEKKQKIKKIAYKILIVVMAILSLQNITFKLVFQVFDAGCAKVEGDSGGDVIIYDGRLYRDFYQIYDDIARFKWKEGDSVFQNEKKDGRVLLMSYTYWLPSVLLPVFLYCDDWAIFENMLLKDFYYIDERILEANLDNDLIYKRIYIVDEEIDFESDYNPEKANLTIEDAETINKFLKEREAGKEAGKILIGNSAVSGDVYVDYVYYPVYELLGRIDEQGKFID